MAVVEWWVLTGWLCIDCGQSRATVPGFFGECFARKPDGAAGDSLDHRWIKVEDRMILSLIDFALALNTEWNLLW